MAVTEAISGQRPVPSYGLYGELLSGDYRDPVHHETISERSSKHDWTIRLHRHRGLAQIFLVKAGRVSYRVEDKTFTTEQPFVLFMPPGVAHGFRFDETVEGDVLSLRVSDLWGDIKTALNRTEFSAVAMLDQGACDNFDHLGAAFAQLSSVYHDMMGERDAILEALVKLILVYIAGDVGRAQSSQLAGASDRLSRDEKQAEAFCAVLEARFSEDLLVKDYAKVVGVSAPHLTRVCKRVLGSPPNELVRQRRLLEASRLLEYTTLPVSEVSYRSGFNDPSFFTRTFRRAYGVPPKFYRAQKDGEGGSRLELT